MLCFFYTKKIRKLNEAILSIAFCFSVLHVYSSQVWVYLTGSRFKFVPYKFQMLESGHRNDFKPAKVREGHYKFSWMPFGIPHSVSLSHNKITRSFSAYQRLYMSFRPKLHEFSLWNISISNVSSGNCNEKNTKQNEF